MRTAASTQCPSGSELPRPPASGFGASGIGRRVASRMVVVRVILSKVAVGGAMLPESGGDVRRWGSGSRARGLGGTE